MAYYRVVLMGENFPLRVQFRTRLMGFYTTRFVEATDPEEAEIKAVELLRNDEKLQNSIRQSGSFRIKRNKPMIHLDEMYEVNREEMRPDEGYAFFPMSD